MLALFCASVYLPIHQPLSKVILSYSMQYVHYRQLAQLCPLCFVNYSVLQSMSAIVYYKPNKKNGTAETEPPILKTEFSKYKTGGSQKQ